MSSSMMTSKMLQTLSRNRAMILRPNLMGLMAARSISTTPLSTTANMELLNQQRALRPNSPHFTIYQPQLTWLSSIANRVTGTGLSVGMYALFIGHLALPALGVPFDSATLVSVFADLPSWFKLSAKAIVTFPAAFHTFNGLRHLGWDMGYFLALRDSYVAGYSVIAVSVASTLALISL